MQVKVEGPTWGNEEGKHLVHPEPFNPQSAHP